MIRSFVLRGSSRILAVSLFTSLASASAMMIAGCAAGSDVDTSESAGTVESAATATTLVPRGALAKGVSKTGVFTATTAGELVFQSAGTGDVDLYIKKGQAPSRTRADCSSEGETATETCRINVAPGDRVYFLLYAYSASNASLTVSASSASSTDYASKLSLPTLIDSAEFTAFSAPGGTLSTSGRSLKFFIDNRNPNAKTVDFLNGHYTVSGKVPDYAKYHYNFAQRQHAVGDTVAAFNAATYFTQAKRYFAGTIQTYTLGESTAPTFAVQFYPDDVIAEETILEALRFLKPALAITSTIPGAKLAFVATGPQQTFARIGTEAAALGFDLFTIDQVLGNIKYVGLNNGEAWGYLRIMPADSNALRPTDIPVFGELPLDLSVVAGVISKAYQDVNSHVNLKSKERSTPNMVLRDAGPENAQLAPWADKAIHLTVTGEGFSIEATTDAVVQAKLAAKLNKPWVKLPVVDETRYLSFDEICPSVSGVCLTQSPKYGGKAVGLSFLSNPSALGRADQPGTQSATFGYDLSPRGFGIPVKLYRDFVDAPENATLKDKVNALIAAEKAGNLSPNERTTLAKEVQELFYTAKIPGTALADITARITTLLPGVPKFKLRSSATSEDVPNFNGAGLYDSFSAELSKKDNADMSCKLDPEVENGVVTKLKMKPKTVQCALKGVFASLWNPRALEERSFARLDHATAGMGIALNPSYDLEDDVAANAVIITRVLASDVYGYSLSIQQGNNLVTNPEPNTISEFDVAAFSDPGRPPRFTTTRYAKPTQEGATLTSTVLTEKQMTDIVTLAKSVEVAYCKAKPGYYSGSCASVWLDTAKPLSLDMEMKILANGQYVVKQVREFHGH